MSKESNNSLPIWLQIGGPLPTLNSKSFSLKDLKPSRKSLANFVVTVPPKAEEKHVKISRMPLILKYLKNHWVWHNKNGTEKGASPFSRKRQRTTPTERDDDNSNNESDDDTPKRSRRSEPFEEEIGENQGLETEGNNVATNSIISALNETAANEGREVIVHHFRHDYLSKQLDNENNKPSTSSTNLINLNTCMAAREIEEEEKIEEENNGDELKKEEN